MIETAFNFFWRIQQMFVENKDGQDEPTPRSVQKLSRPSTRPSCSS